MARKKKSGSTKTPGLPGQPQTQGHLSTVPKKVPIDHRPETSPYASPACNLPFASPMVVALDVLKNKAPKLYAAYDSQSPELPTISEEIGHVIVHYLYTNKYESLKPTGADKLAKQIVELKTAIKVYIFARAYDLPDLVRLAERNVEKFGDGMALPTLLEVASDAYPSLADSDQWFIGYLKKRIRLHLNDASSLLGTDLLSRLSHILSPNKILLRIVLEVCCEQMTNPKQELASPITSAESSRATSRTRDLSRDERKQSPLAEEATPEEPEVKAIEVAATPVVEAETAPEVEQPQQVEVNRAPSELEAETVPESEVVAAVVPETETKVELVGRDRKDSGKELNDELPITLSTEPVIKELDASTHDLPIRPRVNREADSGFWEPTTPAEAEAVKEHNFLELQSAPAVSELSAESEAAEVKETEEDVKQDKGKAVDAEIEVTETPNQFLHLAAIPENAENVVESTTEDALKITQEVAVEEQDITKPTEKAETTPVDNEVDSSDADKQLPEQQQQLTDAAADSAERQNEAQHEHELSPAALRDAAKSVVSFAVSDDQKAELGVHEEPRTVGVDAETKSTTTGDLFAGAEPTESALVSAPKVSSKIDVSDKTEEVPVHPGMNPRSKSWKRRLSMRVPALFGRGM
ncbi:hypothetical protein SMACR_08204 [Sordaria macrospora]|uniref:Uncharacterized protein n=1 Tax=Sordaria macrospora TaxID=5147 RepID=A0A8S8ZES2_SORMA|nr:hypothetical protein SMACR_08204 [Sordaria macrospora]WPJ61113.1 hypothetical protein SMAC4_08204 [Sordaria macrospora]